VAADDGVTGTATTIRTARVISRTADRMARARRPAPAVHFAQTVTWSRTAYRAFVPRTGRNLSPRTA
jgi:hypothetical protein